MARIACWILRPSLALLARKEQTQTAIIIRTRIGGLPPPLAQGALCADDGLVA